MTTTPNDLPTQPQDPRVRFAAERTLLAWMRTGLALMGFGFVVARFGLFLCEIAAAGHVAAHQHSTGWSLWIGVGLIARTPPCGGCRVDLGEGEAMKRYRAFVWAEASAWNLLQPLQTSCPAFFVEDFSNRASRSETTATGHRTRQGFQVAA